jgi:acyl-CoA hydrolase
METKLPLYFDDASLCAEKMIEMVGPRVVVATPLGIGKPVQFLNALYKLACKDSSLELVIITALSFLKPTAKNDLAKRLLDPFFERVYGDYEDLHYEKDRRAKTIPKNIRVIEFFFSAGAYLDNAAAQRDFISSSFTHVSKNIECYGINIIASMIAKEEQNKDFFSLSSNVDIMGDFIRNKNKDIYLVGQVNNKLPYMKGEHVEITKNTFDIILENKAYHRKLFSVPKELLTDVDFALGLRVSTLIKDNGCLQIGIGSLNDAVIYALVLRHKHNCDYQKIAKELHMDNGDLNPFESGLFGSTELLVDGYLELYKNGILKKIIRNGAGSFIAQAGFFIGSNDFYKQLNDMPKEERALFSMRSINELNQLYGDENTRRQQRENARFINSCLQVTLFGESVSDSLENGLTISGVGGQYNFVAMAHELLHARSIVMCRSWRKIGGKTVSNILFNAKNITIPRYLRDIIVTEYGIADIRGKTDEEVIKAILAIADSRFQEELLQQAKSIQKIAPDYKIPSRYRSNFPEKLSDVLRPYRQLGFFNSFPFGTEFEDNERVLLNAFKKINEKNKKETLSLLLKGFFKKSDKMSNNLLKRLNLYHTKSLKEGFYRTLILGALESSD